MKETFNAFAKKLFGVRYKKLLTNVFVFVAVYGGLKSAELHLSIAPFVLYLTSFVFTAGVMFQALGASDTVQYIRNMIMMPFEERKFLLGMVGAIGLHTLVTKTALVWALVFSVSECDVYVIAASVAAALLGVLIPSCIFVAKRLKLAGWVWAGSNVAMIFLLKGVLPEGNGNALLMTGVFAVNALLGAILLTRADGYAFYDAADGVGSSRKTTIKSRKNNLVWTYLVRYLAAHKAYLSNTVIMWGVACILPLVMTQMGMEYAKYFWGMGFAIISMNTPLCILLSCDPATERTVKSLPGGVKAFCVPYALFLLVSVSITYTIYLISWQLQIGGVSVKYLIAAAFLAVLGSILNVVMEWFWPIRGWSIESDLWHHPRKYVVPAVLLLAGAAVSMI